MKKFAVYSIALYCAFMLLLLARCTNSNPPLSVAESSAVKDSVTQMLVHISTDVSARGPAAWINYFENNAGFFMSSDGALAFKDYPSAKSLTLGPVVKNFKKISLSWKNLRVDPLTANYASLGADFHEDIIMANDQNLTIDGYFTGTAHFDGSRWKLRNMNWAPKAPEKPACISQLVEIIPVFIRSGSVISISGRPLYISNTPVTQSGLPFNLSHGRVILLPFMAIVYFWFGYTPPILSRVSVSLNIFKE